MIMQASEKSALCCIILYAGFTLDSYMIQPSDFLENHFSFYVRYACMHCSFCRHIWNSNVIWIYICWFLLVDWYFCTWDTISARTDEIFCCSEQMTNCSGSEVKQVISSLHGLLPSYFLSFHPFILIAWLADGDSLMCYIVMMGRLIAQMFSTFSLWGCLFIMCNNLIICLSYTQLSGK